MNSPPPPGGGIRVGFGEGGDPRPGAASLRIENDDPGRIRTLDDLALTEISLEQYPVVSAWRDRLFRELPEICDELPRLLTEYLRQPEAEQLSPATRRARALRHVFTEKTPLVSATDLLPGSTTTSFVGPVVYPDMIGYCIWPELSTVATRLRNPFRIRPEVAERLNKEIFPFWLDRRPVQESARYSDYDTADYANDGRDRVNGSPGEDPPLTKRAGETPRCQELMERVAFYLSDKATCVSHTVPDFGRVLEHGLEALAERMSVDAETAAPEQAEFLRGVAETFEGAVIYAGRLALAAQAAGNTELAAICRKVPAKPAKTLHEALASIWICYHLLLQENTNFGFSIGRLDQLVNRYYLADWEKQPDDEARKAFVARAVELVCHFFLKCSDHVPLSTEGSETLFAGSGSNQALTVGGTRLVDGEVVNAVNDMSYVILRATELLAIRDPNVHARYHRDIHHRAPDGTPLPDGVVDPWLLRICRVNIVTRATPALHGDVPVIRAMADYYAGHDGVTEEEALADAHDYASIGCIEQNSAGRHYGNTGSTLLVLPAVLELALFGGKHRSDGIDADAPNLFTGRPEYTTPPLVKMRSMEDFIEAFRRQLREMARHAVQNNNYLGRTLERERPSPFLSGLYEGPTNTPDGDGASLRDLSAGGAKYNSAGVAVIGLADVIDSFCAIDALIFGGRMTAKEMLAALEADFDPDSLPGKPSLLARIIARLRSWFGGAESGAWLDRKRLREIILEIRHAPKYGAGVDQTPGGTFDNSLAVKYTHLLTNMLKEEFGRLRTHRGGRYLPGYWSMTNHAGFGMLAKATPNGRKAGRAFASGITPCPGIVKQNGDPVMILDHMKSVSEVDGDTVRNGYTYNLSLTTRGRDELAADTGLFGRYMRTFMSEEGVLVQMCVSSIEEFEAADRAATAATTAGAGPAEQAALEPFRDLMIRVAGYSAYFVTLSPQMRREIIERANFALENGVEQHALVAV